MSEILRGIHERRRILRWLPFLGAGSDPVVTSQPPRDDRLAKAVADALPPPAEIGAFIDGLNAKPETPKPTPTSDPEKDLAAYDYRSFKWGDRFITTFVAEGSTLTTPDPEEHPRFDEVVEGCTYVNGFDVIDEFQWRNPGAEDYRQGLNALEHEIYVKFREEGRQTRSAAFQEAVLREVYQEPALEIRHAVTGVEAGWSFSHFGIIVPEKM